MMQDPWYGLKQPADIIRTGPTPKTDEAGKAMPGRAILAAYRDLKGSFHGDIDVEVDVDIDGYFGCLRKVSKSLQVLLNCIEAVLVRFRLVGIYSNPWEFASPYRSNGNPQQHHMKEPTLMLRCSGSYAVQHQPDNCPRHLHTQQI